MDWSLFMDTQLGTGECDLFCRMRLCFTETHRKHTHRDTHTHTHTHRPVPQTQPNTFACSLRYFHIFIISHCCMHHVQVHACCVGLSPVGSQQVCVCKYTHTHLPHQSLEQTPHTHLPTSGGRNTHASSPPVAGETHSHTHTSSHQSLEKHTHISPPVAGEHNTPFPTTRSSNNHTHTNTAR